MKRRTLKHLRQSSQPQLHHNVYVVLLDPTVAKLKKVRATNPSLSNRRHLEYHRENPECSWSDASHPANGGEMIVTL